MGPDQHRLRRHQQSQQRNPPKRSQQRRAAARLFVGESDFVLHDMNGISILLLPKLSFWQMRVAWLVLATARLVNKLGFVESQNTAEYRRRNSSGIVFEGEEFCRTAGKK